MAKSIYICYYRLYNGGGENNMANYSPLRYPGGKGKMYAQTLKILEDNNLLGCTYIEPFAGGANLALNLLFKGKVNNIILNDYDLAIYAFWYSILNNAPQFIEMIKSIDISLTEREKQKQIYSDEKIDLFKLGFATFYLNRTNRSGIIKGGPIGGKDQLSKYLIDCRFNKDGLIQRIEKIYNNRDKIKLYNQDAMIFLKRKFKSNSFIFIDPPYYNKGAELYENSFSHREHLKISRRVKKLTVPWVLTYDYVDPIIEMYSFCENKKYELSYTVQSKRIGKEVMFYRNSLVVDF